MTATQGATKIVTVSDAQGNYSFADLPDGVWKIDVEMLCFVPVEQDITVAAGDKPTTWNLAILPLPQALAQTKGVQAPVLPNTNSAKANTASSDSNSEKQQPNTSEAPTSDAQGLLLNGSVNNAASSEYSLAQAFGNTRSNSRNLYNGLFGISFGNSSLNARPYSLAGQQEPQPNYNQVTATASVGGPIVIPHVVRRGPDFAVNYVWTRNSNAATETGLVPTVGQRTQAVSMIDPAAEALLTLYPLPNVSAETNYNYQIPVLNGMHQDMLQTRLSKSVHREVLSGDFTFYSTRSDATSLFGFRDTTDSLGLKADLNWRHAFSNRLLSNVSYQFSRLRTKVTPFFANRINVSGDAGLTGNNQDPVNWGPPTLTFSSGIASLTDAQSSFNRNQTDNLAASVDWSRGRHNVTAGGDFRRQEFNFFSQANPRGTFNFTGEAFGTDFSDFLHGVPDTDAIVYGNADKYLRQSVSDLYAKDDWRLLPDLTLNLGVRWEYEAPMTELKNRLANLDVAPDFTAVVPVVAGAPDGTLTGQHYPNSLLRPDRSLVEPRLSLSWRPFAASSLVVRGGYGIYADTSVYQNIALQLAEQPPFSKTISANNTTCPQSLKDGPTQCAANTTNTFGIDPNFRKGYLQVWQASLQRDLPAAMVVLATYRGIKGSDGMQEFLPNTYPLGAVNACPLCPVGFSYQTSTGSSSREEGSVQLRRRLRSGLTATLQYTYSKSIDDDSVLGGLGPLTSGETSAAPSTMSIAQDWRNLRAERSLSSFDQRNLLNATFQYTTGMGLGGGTLLGGWRGRIYKEWTVQGVITKGSGLPETPIYAAAVNDTGFIGTIRPDRTSASIQSAPIGRYLNPAAFTAPLPGQWGNAGRDSITGPGQFTFDSSLSRTFQLRRHMSFDVHLDAKNVLNHVVFSSYNPTINPSLDSPIFGLPTSANAMRVLQIHGRLRF